MLKRVNLHLPMFLIPPHVVVVKDKKRDLESPKVVDPNTKTKKKLAVENALRKEKRPREGSWF